ncbi:MAG TPA: YceI family protein [Janthinobacterium sp.]|nr:YceI family protein [Janthinobacterium sp.]
MLLRTVPCRRAAAPIALIALAALLTACATNPVRPPAAAPALTPPSASAPESQDAYYRAARARGEKVLSIDTQASLISIVVRRGGSLARLGHDHVVASRAIEGHIAPDQGRADLRFRLDQMTVDEAALRTAAGFDSQPSADAIAGTRHNMLSKVLDAERFPLVLMHVTRVAPGAPLGIDITLHGVTRRLSVPVTLAEDAAGGLVVSGSASLNQTDFGLVPFSVMGGAIAVRDRLELHFRIVGAKTTSAQ